MPDEPPETAEFWEAQFQDVLTELVGDKSLERFRQEYEKLHRALKKSHESEKRLIKKCRELNAEIVSNAAKVQTALKLSQEDQTTIASLKREIEKAWKMVDASHEKEARAKETITQLKTEIANLSRLVEQGAGLSMGQENTLNELMREKEELTSERDAQVRLPTSHCILPCNHGHLPTGTGTTVAKHRRHSQHGRHHHSLFRHRHCGTFSTCRERRLLPKGEDPRVSSPQVGQISRLRAEVGMHLAHIRGREAEKANALAEVQVCPHAEDAALTPASRWSFSLASPLWSAVLQRRDSRRPCRCARRSRSANSAQRATDERALPLPVSSFAPRAYARVSGSLVRAWLTSGGGENDSIRRPRTFGVSSR